MGNHSIKHTEFCKRQFKYYDEGLKKYEDKWPNYCKHCDGWGGFWSQYDPSPPGISLGAGYIMDFDTCEHCTDKGICPRCGKKDTTNALMDMTYEDLEYKCPHCGWKADTDDEDSWGLPESPVCCCEMEQELTEESKNGWDRT